MVTSTRNTSNRSLPPVTVVATATVGGLRGGQDSALRLAKMTLVIFLRLLRELLTPSRRPFYDLQEARKFQEEVAARRLRTVLVVPRRER